MDPESYVVRAKAFRTSVSNSVRPLLLSWPHLDPLQSLDGRTDGRADERADGRGDHESKIGGRIREKRENTDLSSSSRYSSDQMSKARRARALKFGRKEEGESRREEKTGGLRSR